MALKNKTAKGARMLQMDASTYALRRNVIDIIYQAKQHVPTLPRIEVRIVDLEGSSTMAYAYLGQNIIHICRSWANKSNETLLELVLHEVVHAVTSFRHDEECPLMRANYTGDIGAKVAWQCFKKYFK